MRRTSSLMRSSRDNSSRRPVFTRSSTMDSLSVRIIFASIRCLTVWRARYPTYSREKIIYLVGTIAQMGVQNAVAAGGSTARGEGRAMRADGGVEAAIGNNETLDGSACDE